MNISVRDLPIHGDPIIDNKNLSIEVWLIRKRIFDNIRFGKTNGKGKAAQQKLRNNFALTFGTAIQAES